MAADYISHFDRLQTPEPPASVPRLDLTAFGRSKQHSAAGQHSRFRQLKLLRRKQQIGDVAEHTLPQPTASVEFSISDTYSNISNASGDDRRAIDLLIVRGRGALARSPRQWRCRWCGALGKGLLAPSFFTGAFCFTRNLGFARYETSYHTPALQLCLLAAR